jgi:hypothetical protein
MIIIAFKDFAGYQYVACHAQYDVSVVACKRQQRGSCTMAPRAASAGLSGYWRIVYSSDRNDVRMRISFYSLGF